MLVTAEELFCSWGHEDNNFQFLNKYEGGQWCWSWLWWGGMWWWRWRQWGWPWCGNENVKSRKIVTCAISFNSFIQLQGNCQKIKVHNILELLHSSKYCDGTHCPCPQHSPRAHIMHKQCIKNIIVGVGNPDNWWTQDSPPQDCPPVGNPEVGNSDYNRNNILHFV